MAATAAASSSIHRTLSAMAVPTENKNTLKYVSLITLTLQNAILGLSMKYANTRVSKEDRFFSSTGKHFAREFRNYFDFSLHHCNDGNIKY